MRTLMILPALLLTLCSAAYAAGPDETIKLKDGTTLVLQADGKMRHLDRENRPLRMAEGKEMEAEDGSKYIMKNNALWRQFWLKGTMNPNR